MPQQAAVNHIKVIVIGQLLVVAFIVDWVLVRLDRPFLRASIQSEGERKSKKRMTVDTESDNCASEMAILAADWALTTISVTITNEHYNCNLWLLMIDWASNWTISRHVAEICIFSKVHPNGSMWGMLVIWCLPPDAPQMLLINMSIIGSITVTDGASKICMLTPRFLVDLFSL